MSTTSISSLAGPKPKALLFDLMGTCLDWHSSIVPTLSAVLSSNPLPASHTSPNLPQLAADWRAGFFEEIHRRFEAGQQGEDIDVTHRRVLDRLLNEVGIDLSIWDDGVRRLLVQGWHVQVGWADTLPALSRLREHFFIAVLANGSTRLQLDIAKSSGLPFHMLFSSELLGLTKPDPQIYRKAIGLMQLDPYECVMVAAHAYDLRAAKKVGMRTVYIQRTTEDLNEDMKILKGEVDLFIDGTKPSKEGGLSELADVLLAAA